MQVKLNDPTKAQIPRINVHKPMLVPEAKKFNRQRIMMPLGIAES